MNAQAHTGSQSTVSSEEVETFGEVTALPEAVVAEEGLEPPTHGL